MPSNVANETVKADSFLLDGRWQRIVDLPRGINSLAADPIHSNVIYAGAGNQGSGSGVYKSEDAGQTWNLSSDGLPVEDVTAVAVDLVRPSMSMPHLVFGGIFMRARMPGKAGVFEAIPTFSEE
jgi:hypothetical protein